MYNPFQLHNLIRPYFEELNKNNQAKDFRKRKCGKNSFKALFKEFHKQEVLKDLEKYLNE